MGLAASQARFLAITARKNNCELQSMQIAQEKLSITREQQKAAQEYEDSLSATKLVWDTVDDDVYDLSYDVLMKPSALNEYDPYLLTDSQGRLVLSTSMFNAAVAAGVIDAKTGDPKVSRFMGSTTSTNDGSRNAFLYQLGVQNQIDSSTIDAIYSLGEQGYTNSGVGGDIIDKTLTNAMATNTFINYMQDATYPEDIKADDGSIIHNKGDAIYGLNLADLFADAGIDVCYTTSPDKDANKGDVIITNNGAVVTEEELKKLTLGDIIDGQYVMTGIMSAEELSKIAIEQVLTEMGNTLGMSEIDTVYGLSVDQESYDALNSAFEFGEQLLNPSDPKTSNGIIISQSVNNAASEAQKINGIVQGTNGVSSVSISNMLKSYLTNFAIAMEGYDLGLYVDDDVAGSSYVTDDINYYFIIKNDNAMSEQDALNADFYNMLYNQLCMNGASTDQTKQQQVTDPDYLNHALKNGQLFISSLNNDGYFYQGHYTLNGHVAEVTDEDAIAQAEAEYNVKKSQLSYKEESLDLELKNIDTELSALTTEYDTVKNLISKNVEKVFTLFSS
jgi:hypothetical protein